jgi:hypothetical protein
VDPYPGILRSIWDVREEVQDPTAPKAFAGDTRRRQAVIGTAAEELEAPSKDGR